MTLLQQLREKTRTSNQSWYDYLKKYKSEDMDNIEIEDIDDLVRIMRMSTNRLGNTTSNWNKLSRWCDFLGLDDYHYAICDDCGSIEYQDDMRTAYDDMNICPRCIDDNYTFSEYRDTYVTYEDADEENEHYEDDYDDEHVYRYDYDVMDILDHTSAPNERILPDTAYYGVELEVEKRNTATSDTTYYVDECFSEPRFAVLKSDGSLSNGFEIVSAPATLQAHRLYWEKFFKSDVIKQLKGWNTDTAGLHIHISRTALRQLDIGKILVFINDTKNESFINHIAGRNAESWAKKSPKKIMDCVQSSEKYSAVNTSHYHTIELRIFKSNLARLGFHRVLEFVDALVHFAKQTSISKLQCTDFLEYMEQPNVRSQYPIFYGWLTRKSYCVGKPSRKVDWSDEQNNLKEIA